MKRTDGQIRADVIQALRDDPRVGGAELGVHVSGGVVTLAGTAGSWAVKMAAQDIARRVPGSTGVRNWIVFPMADGAGLGDADVARAVRQALERDLPALGSRVSCTVSAGWVTLEGAVDHWKQRGAVEQVVRELPGVLGVANQLEFRTNLSRQDDLRHSGTPA
ncbi:MAG: BON domain-containing protein [Gammaproteobacteria bacterium]|nr:BON domain-containing protein [Gammaproteobacteria bacterium]